MTNWDGGYITPRKLEADQSITVDFGNVYTCPGSVGDTVWRDADGNGTQDPGEPGIPSVTVDLNDPGPDGICGTADDAFIASDVTDAIGNYLLTGLPQGTYCVDPDETAVPASYALTTANDPQTVDLGPGEDFLDADFGYQPLGSIGDYVWLDTNGNGIQDDGDTGINGVLVELWTCAVDLLVTSTTTADDGAGNAGYYLFADLPPGCYKVSFHRYVHTILSPLDQGTDDELDSDANPSTGGTVAIDLSSGETDLTWDAGRVPASSICGYVYVDADDDGVFDTGEEPIPGVEVTINGTNDLGWPFNRSTTTGADGSYCFFELRPGTYTVSETQPAGYLDGQDTQGTPGTGTTGDDVFTDIVLGLMVNGQDNNFGELLAASLGDYVWLDDDGDGMQDDGDTGINGVTVNLYTCAGDPVASTTSADDGAGNPGYYLFADLTPGCYEVEFVAPAGTFFSRKDWIDDTFDSDADPATGRTDPIDLSSGETDLTWDAGLYELASLGDYVWLDVNGNGIQDDGDTGINGVTVELRTCWFSFVAGTTTADDGAGNPGYYLFADLTPGCYEIVFERAPAAILSPQDQGADDALDSDADPITRRTSEIHLSSGEIDLTQDAGQFLMSSIHGYVYVDADDNGVFDAGEDPIPGVEVTLSGTDDLGNPVNRSTTTNAYGAYYFIYLRPGTYTVTETQPAGYLDGQDTQGTPGTGTTGDDTFVDIVLGPGIHGQDNNFGELLAASLGDYAWQDTNGNGIQDDGDTGVNGVTVELYTCAGDPVASTTTADDGAGNPGYYLFTDLTPGCYEVEFVLPMGYVFSPQDQGADDSADSDADPATGRTGPIDLSSGETDLTWDAGLYEPICDLQVTKSCLVTPAPTTDLFCTDKIVATTLRYIGPTILGATVEINPDKSPTVVYSGVDLISGVTVLTLPAESGFSVDARPDEAELGSKTKIRVNGVEEVIHTSCSTPYVAGQPAPLDNPKGDPSPNWFVENFLDKDSPEIVELPAPPVPSDPCEFTLGPTPSCETEDKPTSLTFRFTGGTCADSANTQGGKFSCSDESALDPAQPVQIVMLKDADKIDVTPHDVSVGELVNIARNDGADFASETILEIRQAGALIQEMNIHTSCSAPLVVGDVFGGLELVEFNGQRAGAEVTYLYEVINLGDPLTDVTLTDQVNGETVFSAGPFDLLTSDPVAFQWVTQIAETTDNAATFSGFLADGRVCEATDTATVTAIEPCSECKGGTTELTFQYLGTSAANVAVYDDNDAKPDKKLFEGLLEPGDEFTITPRPGQDDLNNDISIWVEGVFNAKIHTSCSQPIGPGLIAGDFLILEGRSKDNGLMCPLNTCAPDAAPAIEFHDKEIRWNVTNVGDLGLEISRIEITWPDANGYLDEIKRDGDAIHKGDFSPPSAVIDSGWEGNPDKRTIKPGETDTLKFKFQNDASMQGEYSILVEFTYGCSIEVTYEPGAVAGVFTCSKPIDALTMIWNGGATEVWVTAWMGSVGSTALTTLAPVSFGNALTASGFAGSPNDVYWEIFADASGTDKLGESTFHLSCSDSGMDGADDCGTPQGDGKDKAGFLNDWLLEGLVDSDETLVCTP
jgi:hypothetical protein